ncbi:multiple sugar transport system permease protein/putative aldouronate transport system permease protein [Cohnella sp. SGD-V74]|uniref:ABC transporter permease n=1 Tax=unclassified Cohnella TaxID=2636738 RepID=UPI000D467849|nr:MULTISPECIES: ABC transporter permease subunit [unclassified Cohnella]PRX74353.1 multiple sugar transport system permease protein/putative aldouronate transport system permease protein [Cohnella sp. SGD-V74]
MYRPLERIFKVWQLYALLALPLLYLIVFKYVPMYGAQIAFKDFTVAKGIWDSDWVGLKHFDRFVHSYDFGKIMANTLLLNVYNLIAGFPFPLILALGLNYVRVRWFKKTVQMVTYAPHFISTVVMVGMLFELLDPRNGIVNNLLQAFGFEAVNFMGNPEYFKSIYVWSGIWQSAGFNCIIFLAALSSIDPSLHEAAVIDGASQRQRMLHIDLPGIVPVAVILLILNMGSMLDVGFEKVLLMQNPLNTRTSEVIDTYVYKVGLVSQAMNYSYSAAIGLFKSVIGFLLILAVNQLARKTNQASLW